MGGKEGQHPKDLKRIQYNVMWREFYEEYSTKGKVFWVGLYSYKDINVWGLFEPESYLKRHEGKTMVTKSGHKASYSCHIYLNDLFQGFEKGKHEKIDKNNNIVRTFSASSLREYLEGTYQKVNPIIEAIKQVNETKIKWNEWIKADIAIPYMKNLKTLTGFTHWKQNLWNGWYTEALYSEYFHFQPNKYIDYVATTQSDAVLVEYNHSGLDLAFPEEPHHFIGDLKAVCVGTGNMLLNDISKVMDALKAYKRIWFIIYIHEKKRGKQIILKW